MFGDVPTHGPWCRKVHSYKTKCPGCRDDVVYYQCSCGSKLFFLPDHGGVHDCRSEVGLSRSVSRIQRPTPPPPPLVSCPTCRMRVREDRLPAHQAGCGRHRH
jgi:hypothetical protein